MRASIVVTSLAVIVALASNAEETVQKNEPEKAVYVLIDASGSMHDRYGALKAEIDDLKSRLTKDAEGREASFNFFRAETAQACNQSFQFAAPSSIANFKLEDREYFNDETPLGGALLSLLQEIGDQPADIYIVSDGEQSLNCGPDICDVANSYLPREGIVVEPLLVSPNRGDKDRLGCIKASQLREKPPSPPAQNIEELNGTYSVPPNFLERWLWFFGFLAVSWASFRIGAIASKHALELANETQTLRSLQTSIMLEDNELAKSQLENLLAKIRSRLVASEPNGRKANSGGVVQEASKTDPSHNAVPETEETIKQRNPIVTAFTWTPWSFSFGLAGILLLLILAFGQPEWERWGFSIGRAQAATWVVMDSDFATAFAGIWIAIVFFVSTQAQRLLECKHEHGIATNEAGRVEKAKLAKERYAAESAWVAAKDAVSKITIRDPWPSTYSKALTVTDTDRANFEIVIGRAKELATGRLSENDQRETQMLKSETKRLREFAPRFWSFGFGVDFASFIGRLFDQMLIKDDAERAMLEDVRKAIAERNILKIKSALSEISEKLSSTRDQP